jgi:endonuclease/exonuclease/phosphatase family metal-dependent hydrolase
VIEKPDVPNPRPPKAPASTVRLGLLLAVAFLVGFWVLTASRAGARVEGCPQDCATIGERQEGPLRVLSLNVLHGFPRFEHLSRRLDLIAAEIRRQDADIVCLQEVPWTLHLGSGAQYLAEHTDLNHLYLRANGNRRAILFEEGEVILSRFPLRDVAFVELRPQAGFFEHRVVLRATAATPWGDVGVFTTHLTDGDREVNRQQAESLLSFVAASGSGPAVVAGDLNAVPDSTQIETLAQQWTDTRLAASPGDDGFTCCIDDLNAEIAESLDERIDYLFLVPANGTRVVASQRVLDQPFRLDYGWQWASDHVGLLAAIELQP